MKALHLSIIIMSILLVILLQPVHAQEHSATNPRNVTLLIEFDSPSLQRCCESIALSHDGSMLAYSIDSFDVKSAGWKSFLSLYFFKNQTSRSLDLNNNLEMIYDLNFSPDDKKLLFVGSSCDKKQSTTTYYIFNPSDIQLHCNTMSNINSVDWMPDGSIVILRNNEKNDTVSIYHNGTEKLLYEKQIEPPYISLNSSHIWSISTSPDGKKIALWYLVMFDHKTQILDVNTGKIITTVDGGHPEWSADGHTLSYTLPTSTGFLSNGARGVDTSINLLDVASNKTTALYHIPAGVDFTSVTPNGTKVLYATNPAEPYKFFGIKAGIYAINLINGNNMTPSSIRQPMLTIDSPLKQFKSGIPATDVKCKDGFEIIIKATDNSPACVRPNDIPALYLREWVGFAKGDLLYLIPQNSEGKIVVKYNPRATLNEIQLNPRIYDGKTGYQASPSSIQVIADQSFIPAGEETSVTYTVTSHDTKGIHWLDLGTCQFIPIVVGLDISQITDSDLDNVMTGWKCPLIIDKFHVISLDGIVLKWR